MNVATITMSPGQAKARLRTYRKALHAQPDREYERAAQAYRALASGTPLLQLSAAFAECPLDAKNRPRIAIARADQAQVRFRSLNGSYQFRPVTEWRMSAASSRVRSVVVAVPVAVPQTPDGYALVPMVPPEAREKITAGDLCDHWVLWEVEAWADQIISATPDRDPYLLRRIADDLYAVIAAWDLTEVERAIMRDRARA